MFTFIIIITPVFLFLPLMYTCTSHNHSNIYLLCCIYTSVPVSVNYSLMKASAGCRNFWAILWLSTSVYTNIVHGSSYCSGLYRLYIMYVCITVSCFALGVYLTHLSALIFYRQLKMDCGIRWLLRTLRWSSWRKKEHEEFLRSTIVSEETLCGYVEVAHWMPLFYCLL